MSEKRNCILFIVCYFLTWVGLVLSVDVPIGSSFIFGGWTYYTYGLLISVAALIGTVIMTWRLRRNE